MRKDVAALYEQLEKKRVENMKWWKESDDYKKEIEASRSVLIAYEHFRSSLSTLSAILLDQVEEEMFLIKEAELQMTYMQGFSDCLDYLEESIHK